jgi:hypothetical protein
MPVQPSRDGVRDVAHERGLGQRSCSHLGYSMVAVAESSQSQPAAPDSPDPSLRSSSNTEWSREVFTRTRRAEPRRSERPRSSGWLRTAARVWVTWWAERGKKILPLRRAPTPDGAPPAPTGDLSSVPGGRIAADGGGAVRPASVPRAVEEIQQSATIRVCYRPGTRSPQGHRPRPSGRS